VFGYKVDGAGIIVTKMWEMIGLCPSFTTSKSPPNTEYFDGEGLSFGALLECEDTVFMHLFT